MIRVYILIIVNFAFCQHTSAANIDDYIERLNKAKLLSNPIERDTQLIWEFNYVSEDLSRYMDPRAEAYLDTLFTLSSESDWKSAMPFYHRAMGRHHDFRGEPTEALDYYTKAIEGFKVANVNLKELAFSYVLKGFLLSNSDMQDECMDVFEEGLPYARAAKGKNSLCLMLDWYGDYYYYGLDSIVDNQKALDYYKQVHEILPQINYQRIIADNYAVLSGVYGRLGKRQLSVDYFQIADSISKEHHLPFVRWGLYAEKARQLEEKGLHQKANQIYVQCQEFIAPTTNIEFKSRLEEALWKNYKNLGDNKRALFHYEQHVEMENKMATHEVEQKYNELQTKYNNVLQEQEINDLRNNNQKNIGYFLFGLLGLVSLFSFFVSRKNVQLNRSALELEEKQKEVNIALIKGEKDERKRLAGELHDNVNTKLAAIKWRLEAVSDEVSENAKTVFDDTIEMMNNIYTDVRNISHNLVPAKLEETGLLAAIHSHVITLNSAGRTQFKFIYSSVDEDDLADMKYPLYNVIFELMNNVVKHSQAEHAEIVLRKEKNKLELSIKDNGKGFTSKGRTDGIGFQNVKSRIQALQGKLNIDSQIGKGTTVNIDIPFNV